MEPDEGTLAVTVLGLNASGPLCITISDDGETLWLGTFVVLWCGVVGARDIGRGTAPFYGPHFPGARIR